MRLGVLQWSRGIKAAETLKKAGINPLLVALQWSRGIKAAETTLN